MIQDYSRFKYKPWGHVANIQKSDGKIQILSYSTEMAKTDSVNGDFRKFKGSDLNLDLGRP